MFIEHSQRKWGLWLIEGFNGALLTGGAFDFSKIVNSEARTGSLSGNKWVSNVCTGHAASDIKAEMKHIAINYFIVATFDT